MKPLLGLLLNCGFLAAQPFAFERLDSRGASPPSSVWLASPASPVTADLNGDGITDLVIANTGFVQIFFGELRGRSLRSVSIHAPAGLQSMCRRHQWRRFARF